MQNRQADIPGTKDQADKNQVLLALIDQGLVTDPHSPRGRLIAKAAHLFKEKGFERTTVRDLASEVGILSGSIFHHFKSKQEILKAVMEEAIHYNTALMHAALENADTAKEKILALILCELEAITGTTGEAMAVLVFEWRSLSADYQQEILKLRDAYEALWTDALTEAQSDGLVQGDLFVLRRLLSGALNWTPTWYKREGSMSLQQLAEQALLMIVKE